MQRGYPRLSIFAVGFLALPLSALDAAAQLAVSANDSKAVLVDGVNTVPANPAGDTVSIIDRNPPPKLLAEIKAPTSVVGPPSSVAVAPDEFFALVTAATKIDPAISRRRPTITRCRSSI